MKKNKHTQLSPKALIEREKGKTYVLEAYKLTKALALAVLFDRFEFSKEDGDRFLDDLDTLLESIGYGTDDLATIKKNLKEMMGVDVH